MSDMCDGRAQTGLRHMYGASHEPINGCGGVCGIHANGRHQFQDAQLLGLAVLVRTARYGAL